MTVDEALQELKTILGKGLPPTVEPQVTAVLKKLIGKDTEPPTQITLESAITELAKARIRLVGTIFSI